MEGLPSRARSRRWRLLRIAGVGLLAVTVGLTVDLRALWASLANVSPLAVAGLVVLATADRLLMAVKWWHLARGIGIAAPLREFLAAYYGATLLAFSLPSTLGGEVYRGWRLSRAGGTARVVASMLMERALAVVATLALAVLGLALLAGSGATPAGALPVLGAASALAVGVLALSLHAGAHDRLLALARRFGAGRPAEKLLASYALFRGRGRLLAGNGLLALAEACLEIALLAAAARALGIAADSAVLVAILAVARAVRRVAMVLDGWGLSEALHILLFGLVGVSGSEALALSLLGHAAGVLAGLPGGIVLLGDRHQREAERERLESIAHAGATVPGAAVADLALLPDPRPHPDQLAR